MQQKTRFKGAEFLCPDCGHMNKASTDLLAEKYQEHHIACSRCNHLLEIVVADGLDDKTNIIASSLDTDFPAA